jgi:methionyl-tRNA formyltransferase
VAVVNRVSVNHTAGIVTIAPLLGRAKKSLWMHDTSGIGMEQRHPLRIVFFGTPAFAVPALKALEADDQFDVRLVVTRPDRPSGRGLTIGQSPVKLAAEDLNLRVYQPSTLRSDLDRAPLMEAEADLFVVAAFGLIFGPKTLAIPRLASVNLHASILPKYRGASPVAASIAAGEAETGISLMVMEAGLDTGPVIATSKTAIDPSDTTESLTEKLANLGAELAVDRLSPFGAGALLPTSQRTEGASMVRSLTKADGWLDWNQPAERLERWVRAMWSWPRAWTTLEGLPLQVHRSTVSELESGQRPGTVMTEGGTLSVQTGGGALVLDLVQFSGGKPMLASAALAGGKVRAGLRLGKVGSPEPQLPFIVDLSTE